MSNNALYTIEQVDNKLIITVEAVKTEQPKPTMIRSNDGNTETIEFVNPPLTINTNQCGLDLSKYKPFPKDYIATKEIKAIRVNDPDNHIKIGTIGTIRPDGSNFPRFDYGQGQGIECPQYSDIKYLAPLDPSDHTDYKQEQIGIDEKDVAFHCDERKTDTSEMRPMNAEEISDWAKNVSNLSIRDKSLLHRYINDAIQYELNKAKR